MFLLCRRANRGKCITLVGMTELQHAAKAVFTRPRIQPAEEGDDRPLSISVRLGQLQFHNSGKFRVLQFADVQEGPEVSKDTIRLVEASLDATRPDIVIFTGNQIAGYDSAYSATSRKRRWNGTGTSAPENTSTETDTVYGAEDVVRNIVRRAARERAETAMERTKHLVRSTMERLTGPISGRGIPWVVTFGNHDFQCGLDNAAINAICCELPGCLNPASFCDGEGESIRESYARMLPGQRVYSCEPGTFALPVMDCERKGNVLGLVLADSGDYAPSGGYGSPSETTLNFLADVPYRMSGSSLPMRIAAQPEEAARMPRCEAPLPCMVFQHFAIPQYYDLLRPAAYNAARAIEGYRNFAGKYYVLDESKTQPGGYLGEGISCPDADSGEHGILLNNGFFAISAGHDHRNAFAGTDKGLTMIASPTSGFGSYGPVPERRAARLIEFDIRHPYEPRTQLLEYGELVGKPSLGRPYAYGMTSESRSDSKGVDLLHRPTLLSLIAERFGMA
jgi:hypothetical protein